MAEGHRKRVVEKVFDYGIETLHEHEFLELCLYSVFKRQDTNKLAHKLLKKFGNLENVCRATAEELRTIEGIGPAAAEHIRLIPFIAKGYNLNTAVRKLEKYDDKEKIYKRCIALLQGVKHEEAYLLCFDRSKHLVKEVRLADGSVGNVSITPRKILESIANTSTDSVMLCHNHPSGIAIPSQQDFITTINIKNLLNSIDIKLIDHIVVTDGEYVSCIAY